LKLLKVKVKFTGLESIGAIKRGKEDEREEAGKENERGKL